MKSVPENKVRNVSVHLAPESCMPMVLVSSAELGESRAAELPGVRVKSLITATE